MSNNFKKQNYTTFINTDTISYSELLKYPQWLQKRQAILERDHNRCRNCGKTKNLHVHHRQYHAYKTTGQLVNPWIYQNRYLITLCEKCHSAGHASFKIPTFII